MSRNDPPVENTTAATAEQLEALRARLDEAEATLEAIQRGEADALVIKGPGGARVYTLVTADESYRTLVEQMREAALILSAEGTILYCNARLSALVRDPAPTGRPLADLAVQEDRAAVVDLLERAATGEAGSEIRFDRSAGGPVSVHLSVSALRTAAFTGLAAVVTDLTEQKRREAAAERERLASAVLDFAGTAILVCDAAGRVVRANRAALALCRDECVGRQLEDTLPIGVSYDELREETGAEPLDVTVRLPAGEERFLQVSARQIGAGDGEDGWWVITLADVTGHKRAEDALRRAKEAAEAANRAKSDFLRVTSHELRTPLNSVLGYADLLLSEISGELTGGQRNQVERIQVSARHQVSLIEEILAYARIEAGQEQLQLGSVDVSRIVEEVAEFLRPEAAGKGLGLEVCLPEGGPLQTVTDEVKLRRILINLVGNATKFTREGSVDIAAGWETDGRLALRVTDTGPGIPTDHLDMIWDPFTQVDPSHTRQTGGTGLGLAIVGRLVEFMGGEVQVDTEVGRGTAFTVRLPSTPAT